MSILSAALTLFLVMDPVGAVPVFAALLKGLSARRRSRVIVRENVIALAVLVFFLFFGRAIMGLLGVGEPAINVAGGIVLLIVAVEMIFPGRARLMTSQQEEGEPLIVPLAIPLIAGPSTIAVLMLMVSRHPGHRMGLLGALLVAWTVGLVVLLLAGRLQHVLGRRGLAAAERLMGMVLITIAAEMLMTGIQGFLEQARP